MCWSTLAFKTPPHTDGTMREFSPKIPKQLNSRRREKWMENSQEETVETDLKSLAFTKAHVLDLICPTVTT